MQKCLVITVGSTKFDALIHSINAKHASLSRLIEKFAISRILVQHGASPAPIDPKIPHLTFSAVDYLPPAEMAERLAEASLVISHAGAGTVFEILRSQNAALEALCIVANDSLMDSHQSELVQALKDLKCPIQCGSAVDPFSRIQNVKTDLAAFKLPNPNYGQVARIIKEALKWIKN